MEWVVIGALALNLSIWLWLARGWRLYSPPKPTSSPFFSVIVAARNEEAHLPGLLECLRNQAYPDYEILLVLNGCTDLSLALAQEVAAVDPRLRILEVQEIPSNWSPKKWALTRGVSAARGPWLAFTDADCRPPAGWLRSLAAHTHQSPILIGLSPYSPTRGILGALIRFETWFAAYQYGAMALRGRPFMAVGRNLAYTRDFFEQIGGLESHKGRLSGDDDLLVNQAGGGAHLVAESPVPSIPVSTWGAWFRQKRRHLSASTAYNRGSQVFLALFHGSHTIFYLSLPVMAILGISPCWGFSRLAMAGILIGVRIPLVYASVAWAGPKAQSLGGWRAILFWDPLWVVYNLLMVPAGWLLKPNWKK